MHLSPAEYVIYIFGGLKKTGKAIGRNHASVFRWKEPKENGGTGGIIPTLAQQSIIIKARKLGLDITPDDLIYGREVKNYVKPVKKTKKKVDENEETHAKTGNVLP